MQTGIDSRFRVEDHLPFLDPIVSKWFNSRYDGLTDPQIRAIPLIHEGKNVLVSSPTGTGKTLTGFLSIINELFIQAGKNEIKDQIYAVYISPLKALANDIDKNLKKPLTEIYALAEQEGLNLPEIRVAVRSGDTPQKERQKMLRKPPHILITTPESFALLLSSPKFSEHLTSARYVILDEIHEISSTKRGAFLSLNLERLQSRIGRRLTRIGLSATQAPIQEIAKFLVGLESGKIRDVEIVEVDAKKFLDLSTLTPVPDLTAVPQDVANERMYDILTDLINKHKTTLIFTNTRSSTEHVAVRLKARGIESIEAHHSSLGKETRIDVENKLKNGELKCVITSTSLELGIDIGYIDLVVQIGSPKSVSKGLQRIGRSGHNVNDMSKGRFVVFDLDDLVECAVLTKAAYDREIDRVTIPMNSLDVLSQCLVGMAIEKVWKVKEAYDLVRSSYSYSTLSWEDFLNTVNYLAGEIKDSTIFPKIWIDREEGIFGKKKSARMIFFMNVGTIPDESDYQVINERGKHLGQLSDKFVERLKPGDVFVLGARTHVFLHTSRNKVLVKEATGVKPTVPSWTGELLPRSYDLGMLIGKFREQIAGMLKNGEDPKEFIIENYKVDEPGAQSIIAYIRSQSQYSIPTGTFALLEGYIDEEKNYNSIFHVPLGRRVNDALSRAYALALANKYGVNARVTVTDDGFMLSYQKKLNLDSIVSILSGQNFRDIAKRSITNSEVLKQRFRHCAARSLMILRKYKGIDISVARQQLRSDKVLKTLEEMGNFPVVTEAYREIMEDMMDVPRAQKFVEEVIEKGSYRIRDYGTDPSPFSHGIILSGVSDIVLMEDKSRLLRELQSKILEKVYGSSSISFLINDKRTGENYFRSKVPKIEDEESFNRFLAHFLYIDPFRNRINSPYPYSGGGVADLVEKFISEDRMLSVFIRGTEYTHPDHYRILWALFRRPRVDSIPDQNLLEYIGDDEKTFGEIKKELEMNENEIKDALIKLESTYEIRKRTRGGLTTYIRNLISPEPLDTGDAIREAVKILLGSLGPLTADEISIRLPVDQEMLSSALKWLVDQGILVLDYVTPVFAKQYILSEDLEKLIEFSEFDPGSFRIANLYRPVSSEAEYFSKYGFCFDPLSISIRLNQESKPGTVSIPEDGSVIYGRFVKHQWVFASREFLEDLYALRWYAFNPAVSTFLSRIPKEGITETEAEKTLGYDRNLARQFLRELEYRLSLYRTPSGRYFELFGSREPGDRNRAFLNIVEKYGPVTQREISSYFWFEVTDSMTSLCKSVYNDGERYLSASSSLEDKKTDAILPIRDPFGIYFSRIYSSDNINAVYIKGGKPSGDLHFSYTGGILWVDSVEVQSENLEEFSEVLLGFARTLSAAGIVLRGNVLPEERGGWHVSREMGTAVYGDIDLLGDSGMLITTALFLPEHGNRMDHIYTRISQKLVGIRNWGDASRFGIRVEDFNSYVDSNLLYQFMGPFGVSSYATTEVISLYRAIRGYKPTAEEEKVLRVIMESDGVYEKDLRLELPFEQPRIRKFVDSLYRNCIICRGTGRKLIYVVESVKREEALRMIISFLLGTFGFTTPDLVSEVTGYSDIPFITAELKKQSGIRVGVTDSNRVFYYSPDSFKRKIDPRETILVNKEFLYFYLKDLIPRDVMRGRGNYYFDGKTISGLINIQFTGKIARVKETKGEVDRAGVQAILLKAGYLSRRT